MIKFSSKCGGVIYEKENYFGIYGIHKIGKNFSLRNKEFGKIRFMQAYNIPDYTTCIPVEGGCTRCGFSKFCQCYGFSSTRYKMTGSHGHHFGHGICIYCGAVGKEWKNFMCKDCYNPSIKSREDYIKSDPEKYQYRTEFRNLIFKEFDHRRTFFKDINLKCLECNEGEVDPTIGIIACSEKCMHILLKSV